MADATQALADAETALAAGDENIALAENELDQATIDADLAAQGLADAKADILALEAEYNGTKFDDDEEQAEALAQLNAAVDSLEVDKLVTDIEDTEQAIADAQAALDDAVDSAAGAQAVFDTAGSDVTAAEQDLADAQIVADSLNALADETLEEAANKEVTDEVQNTIDSYFAVEVALEEEVIITE